MDAQTLNALMILFRIILYSLYVAGPIVILIGLMYLYQKYRKYREKEIKEADRIIVKMNEDIKRDPLISNDLVERKKNLSSDVFDLEKRKRDLEKDLGIEHVEEIPADDDTPDYESMTINELKAIAKKRGMKSYSRLSKVDLIKLLG